MMGNESTEKNREVTSRDPDLGNSMEPKQTASCSYLSLPLFTTRCNEHRLSLLSSSSAMKAATSALADTNAFGCNSSDATYPAAG